MNFRIFCSCMWIKHKWLVTTPRFSNDKETKVFFLKNKISLSCTPFGLYRVSFLCYSTYIAPFLKKCWKVLSKIPDFLETSYLSEYWPEKYDLSSKFQMKDRMIFAWQIKQVFQYVFLEKLSFKIMNKEYFFRPFFFR